MVNNDSYLEFFSDIASKQMTEKEFFTNSILDSIEKHFSYKKTLINYYTPTGEFLSWRTREGILLDNGHHPFFSLTENNEVRRVIYDDAKRDDLTAFKVIPRLYKSTDIIKKNYSTNKYVKFYKEQFNAYYTLTMAFGINGYIELLFYKSEQEGDFTELECNELKSIYTYLGNGFSTYKKHEQRLIFSELQNEIVQLGSKAYFITDDFLHIMYYNNLAKEYLGDMLGPNIANNLDDYEKNHWLQLLYGKMNDDPIQLRFVSDYEILIHIHQQHYSNNIIDKYYWITIDKARNINISHSSTIFTKTEKQVCELILAGKKYKEISDKLFISYYTAKKHVSNIYKKANVNSRYEFINWYNDHK